MPSRRRDLRSFLLLSLAVLVRPLLANGAARAQPQQPSAQRRDTVVAARDTVPLTLTPTVVHAERAYTAASSGVVRALDIKLRPRESSQELLRLAPGLVIAQHAGGGKAEQLFLRGFDADHGTDVAVSVDGVPVNMVTHAHGQGYADLHWLMPEVVDEVDVRKGPFDVRDGDFATAGAVDFRTRDRVGREPIIEARGGSFDTRHLVGLLPLGGDASHPGGYVAAAAHYADGPFLRPQDYRRANAFAKWTMPVGRDVELVARASAFDGAWNASGQVPDRAVREGLIPRFGSIDPSEGGTTSRYDFSLGLRSRTAGLSQWEAQAFATRYRFDLFSNFTFFLADTVNGDGIEQRDARTMFGAFASYGRIGSLLGVPARWTVGAGTRGDIGDVALYHQRDRTRLAARVDVRNDQAQLYEWARYELSLAPRLRVDLAVRGDLFRFAVTDRLPTSTSASPAGAASTSVSASTSSAESDTPRGSLTRWHAIVSPKLNVAFDASDATQLFANVGTGFHSNDARDVVVAAPGARVLPRAASAELGARHTWVGGTLAVALWWTDLESETVYVGDEGTTEPSGRTRRVGADLEARQRILPWLWADADVNLARGRFLDEPRDANRIPLAPTITSTAGLTVRDAGPRPLRGVDAGLRARHVGSRAATDDASVRALGYTVWELFAGARVRRARVFAAVDNLFDTTWNEAQFATTSRLRGERVPVTELHYTPGAPRGVQVGVEYRF